MKEEPTVLDYLKAKLSFRRDRQIKFSWEEPEAGESLDQEIEGRAPQEQRTPQETLVSGSEVNLLQEGIPQAETSPLPAPGEISRQETKPFPWLVFLALLLAIGAQLAIEPPRRSAITAIVLYALASGLFAFEILRSRWGIVPLGKEAKRPMPFQIGWVPILVSVPVMLLAFLLFGEPFNPEYWFNQLNVFVWVLSLGLVLKGMWIPDSKAGPLAYLKRWLVGLRKPFVSLKITSWTVVVLLTVGVVVFFRLYHLSQVPGEMFSDHAEKLLDVSDVLNGQTGIFFPRNTGREAFQMYLTAVVSIIFHTGLSFMSLKIGTALMGLVTLPFIYFLGKEVGNRWVGLLAFLLAGIAYWPNVISRVGLRFTLYPLFVAPMLYFLIRGLRRSNRNNIILAGLALGMGLYGYSPMRIVPLVVALLYGVYLLHPQSKGKRWSAINSLILMGYVAFIVFLPLLRYILHDPTIFEYRTLTRLAETERPFPAPVWLVFLSNLWKAMIMFFWDNGSIWVHSIPGRPALDVISAALLLLGMVILVVRYLRKREWVDLWLLLLIPLLMMPSILSLAFPDENPSLNRTSAAIVPVFIICALALEGILSSFVSGVKSRFGKALAVVFILFLLALSATQNYNLVFQTYNQQFMAGAWNTSEIGHVIRGFVDSIGDPDTAYVVPFPYWVDTRLVGINAGFPTRDYALWPDSFESTLADPRAKLFIIKTEDVDAVNKLRLLYPSGKLSLHPSPYIGKDFYLYFVPATQDSVSLP